MRTFGRSPGRRAPPAATGVGANASGITMRAAADLDQWYAANGCTACDDMGSDLRVRTLAFKAAVLLDPATRDQVALNVTTPLAQSGFGPGTDDALSLVLGATRQSKGHCTDNAGFCTVGGMQTPAVPLELQALASALGVNISALLQQAKQVPQTDATLTSLVQQIVAAFKQFAAQLKAALGQKEQPHPPPAAPQPVPQVNVLPAPAPPPVSLVKPTSNVGIVLGVVGIALVALGTGAVIMTATKKAGR